MAVLSFEEFGQSIELLANEIGLQRLSDKFFRYRGLVTRRGFKNSAQLANQVYTLSAGLRRQVPANLAFQAIWAEYLGGKLGEEGAENLEKLADGVNACLDEHERIIPDKQADLDEALKAYEAALASVAGPEMARLDMLMKAVPDIAERLRSAPAAPAPAE